MKMQWQQWKFEKFQNSSKISKNKKIQWNSKNVLNDSKYIINPLKLNFNAKTRRTFQTLKTVFPRRRTTTTTKSILRLAAARL